MSNYKGHLLGGAVAYTLLVAVTRQYHAPWIILGEWLIFCLGGALFPDVDIKSKGQKIFYRIMVLFLIYFLVVKKIVAFMFLTMIGLLPVLVRHRGIFHHPWFILLCGAAPIVYAYFYMHTYAWSIFWDALFFVVGAFSHLILDRGFSKVIKQL